MEHSSESDSTQSGSKDSDEDDDLLVTDDKPEAKTASGLKINSVSIIKDVGESDSDEPFDELYQFVSEETSAEESSESSTSFDSDEDFEIDEPIEKAETNQNLNVTESVHLELDETDDIVQLKKINFLLYFSELHFEILFQIILMFGNYVAIVCTAVDAAIACSSSEEVPQDYKALMLNYIYFIDIIALLDIASMVCFKVCRRNDRNHVERSIFAIIIEALSIPPLDLLYYLLAVPANMCLVYILRLRYWIRFIRLLLKAWTLQATIGHNHFILIGTTFSLTLATTLLITTCVVYAIRCSQNYCKYNFDYFYQILDCVATKVTGRGQFTDKYSHRTIYWIYIGITFASYTYFNAFMVGEATSWIKRLVIQRAIFIKKMRRMRFVFSVPFKFDRMLAETCLDYYSYFWKSRKAMHSENLGGLLPESLESELQLDLSWEALKHSKLFRNEETHILQYVSSVVKHTFMIPGQVVYKRDQFKSKMVYIISGIVQVYSEEDGETPIINLGPGTCLGESSLFCSYPSSCTMVCRTYCEMNVLERTDFINTMWRYGEEYNRLRRIVQDRYDQARKYIQVKKFQLKSDFRKGVDTKPYSLMWIKLTLRRLSSTDAKFLESHLGSLSAEERLEIRSMLKRVFCAQYLDVLAIATEEFTVGDRVFYKTSCPCILQPDSLIAKAMEAIVIFTLMILIFVYPYYALFLEKTDGFYTSIIYIATTIWWLDIYTQVSTAIKTRNGMITSPCDIFLTRSRSALFIIDVVSATPIESVLYFMDGVVDPKMWMELQFNRMLRVGRIERVFRQYENSTVSSDSVIRYVKYFLFLVILIYWTGMFYLFVNKSNNNYAQEMIVKLNPTKWYHDIVLCIFFGVHLVTGVKFHVTNTIPLITLKISILFLNILVLSHLAAILACDWHSRLVLEEHVKTTKHIIEDLSFNNRFSSCITRYIEHQWKTNEAADLLNLGMLERDAPEELLQIMMHTLFKNSLLSVPFFQEIPHELLVRCCSGCRILEIPADQTMTYAGEASSDMYILKKGYCDIISADGSYRKAIRPGQSFAVLESCMAVPVVNTVITKTSCVMVSLSFEDFKRAVALDPKFYIEMSGTIKSDIGWRYLMDMGRRVKQLYFSDDVSKSKSFHWYGYDLHHNTDRGNEYFAPFDKLGYWNFVKYLLLRFTITSYGSFIHYWEYSRCIFAMLTIVLAVVPTVSDCGDCFWKWIFLFLEITALMDIYVRHHVCYFNQKGVEVFHPLKTATNYWKHSFIVDVLGALPSVSIARLLGYKKVGYFKLTRLLQGYRILNLFNYKTRTLGYNVRLWIFVSYIPLFVILINYSGVFILSMQCTFDNSITATDDYEAGVNCVENSFLANSTFTKPFSPIRVYLYGILYASSTLTLSGLHGHISTTFKSLQLLSLFMIVGFLIVQYLTARLIAINSFKNIGICVYRRRLISTLDFLKLGVIDNRLELELVSHFEHVWAKKRGKDYIETFRYFNNSLREDFMCKLFGGTLRKSLVFSAAGPAFFRSLLIYGRHVILIRGGVISRVNDVNDSIFIVHKGEVEVLGSDNNKSLILPVGSMFGNLQCKKLGKRTATVVARSNVELLTISSKNFYQIVDRFESFKLHFKRLVEINAEYLVGEDVPHILHETFEGKKAKEVSFNIHKENRLVIYKIVLFSSCFLDFILEVYRLAVRDQSVALLVVLYFFDVLFVVKIYLKLNSTYTDGNGKIITNKNKIRRHYLRSRLGFGIDFFSLFPFEIFSFISYGSYQFWYLCAYLRVNRLVRIIFVIKYLEASRQILNVNIYALRMWRLIIYTLLLLQSLTGLYLILTCLEGTDNVFPSKTCDYESLSAWGRLSIFFREMSVIISICATTPSMVYYPNSSFSTFLLIIVHIIGRLVVILFVAEVCSVKEIATYYKFCYDRRLDNFKTLNKHFSSPSVMNKVLKHMSNLWDFQKGEQFPSLLEEAPHYLREAVLDSLFGFHLREHKVFSLCEEDLMRQIIERIRTRIFFKGDAIVMRGQIDDCMYFVHIGRVVALKEDGEQILNVRDVFGFEQGLFLNKSHEFTYEAAEYTVLVQLRRSSWIQLLDFFPTSKERMFKT